MPKLYENIKRLCAEHNTNITAMCREAKISRASLSDLKMGRIKTLSIDTLTKVANYFEISVDSLLQERQLVLEDIYGNDFFESEQKNNSLPEMDSEQVKLYNAIKTMSKEKQKALLDMIEKFEAENKK